MMRTACAGRHEFGLSFGSLTIRAAIPCPAAARQAIELVRRHKKMTLADRM
jgi:hypothetical protein